MQCGVVDNQERKVGMYVISASLGLLGMVLVLLCTHRYGVGLSPDSSNYVSAARSLLSGQGYRYVDGGTYTHWPPLFPTLLAIPGLVGVGPMTAARWLNALAFGGIVFSCGLLFARCTTSRITATLGTLSVVLATPLLAVSSMVWSEPVFILLAVVFVLHLQRFAQTKSFGTLATLSVLVGLACLERYTGVTLILTGGIAIALLAPKASVLDRLKYAVGFCLLSAVPLVLWLLRNRLLAGQTTGAHHLNWQAVGQMGRPLVVAASLMAKWFSSRIPEGFASAATVGGIMLLAGVASAISRWKLADREGRKVAPIWPAGLFVLVYSGFIAFSGAGLAWDPEQRHMAPAYAFLMLLVFAGVEDAFRVFGPWERRRIPLRLLGLVLMALLVLHSARGASRTIRRAERNGAGGYSTQLWHQSDLIHWLRANPLDGDVYSNGADVVYLLTGTPAKMTPDCYADAARFAEGMDSSRATYVVWSHNLQWSHLYDLRELASRWRLETLAELSDGAVYRFAGVGGPELFAVYRFWSPLGQRHRYTIDKRERDDLVLRHADEWANEGAVFYVYREDRHPVGARPVFQLWSESMRTTFYTIDRDQRDAVLANNAGTWEDRGVAWYAFAEGEQPPDTRPVYRFWSATLQTHFYTMDQGEKDKLAADPSHVWTYEGVAWYAYGK